MIEREDRSRQIQIWATPRGRALGDIITDMEPRMKALKLPKDVTYAYDGQVRMMKENNEAVGLALHARASSSSTSCWRRSSRASSTRSRSC